MFLVFSYRAAVTGRQLQGVSYRATQRPKYEELGFGPAAGPETRTAPFALHTWFRVCVGFSGIGFQILGFLTCGWMRKTPCTSDACTTRFRVYVGFLKDWGLNLRGFYLRLDEKHALHFRDVCYEAGNVARS